MEPERGQTVLRRVYAAAWLAGVAVLIAGSWVPFEFEPKPIGLAWAELTSLIRLSRADFALNTLIALPIAWAAAGTLRPAPRRGIATVAVAVAAFASQVLLAVIAELGQAWSPHRIASSADVVAQTLGGALGVAGWLLAGGFISHASDRLLRDDARIGHLVWLLGAYAVGFVIWSLMPANPVLSVGELAARWRAGAIRINPLHGLPADPLSCVLDLGYSAAACVPLGVLAVAGGRVANRWRGGGPLLAAVCFAIPFATELAQVLIIGRVASTADALAGTAGVAIGYAAAKKWLTSGDAGFPRGGAGSRAALFWGVSAILLLAVTVLAGWAPLDFSLDPGFVRPRIELLRQQPLGSWRGDHATALINYLQAAVMFVPVGGAIAMFARSIGPLRWAVVAAGTVAIAAAALAIEAGQLALPGRTPDFGEAIAAFAGGVAGVAVAWRLNRENGPR